MCSSLVGGFVVVVVVVVVGLGCFCFLFFFVFFFVCLLLFFFGGGGGGGVFFEAGITEADDREVSQSNRHSTIGTRQTQYHEALPLSENDEVECDCTFADDGNAS